MKHISVAVGLTLLPLFLVVSLCFAGLVLDPRTRDAVAHATFTITPASHKPQAPMERYYGATPVPYWWTGTEEL